MGGQVDFIKSQLRNWRGLERLVEQEEFQDFYCDLSDKDQTEVTEYIISGKLDTLRDWMKAHKKQTLEGQSIAELRLFASTMGIHYYNTLSRKQLIYKIRRIRRNEYQGNMSRKVEEVCERLGASRDF